MASLKISVIGAGSYVFGPSVLNQCICENHLDGLEISLHDVDGESLAFMAKIGERMVMEQGLQTRVTFTTNRRESLDGASFVVYCAAPQLYRNFQIDSDLIDQFAPGEYKGEFGGIAGISYSLRQIALMEQVTADIRELCPTATLLCTANPLPRLIQAAHQQGVSSVGFCSASSGIYADLWRLFGGADEPYPWSSARAQWDIEMGGVNHFSWLLSVREKTTGRDVMSEIKARLLKGATLGSPRSESFLKDLGSLLLPNDHHTQDFLPLDSYSHPSDETPAHGTTLERSERMKILREIAEGRAPWSELVRESSWERTADVIGALGFNQPAQFTSLNLINSGQMPQLPSNVFVETPATADITGIHPETLELPEVVLPMTLRTAQVTERIVQGAVSHRREPLLEAIELDPTILNKTAAAVALDECIKAHALSF